MTQNQKALLAAFASVFAASFSAIFIRIALMDQVNPVVLAFWRLFLTCLIMLPYTLSKATYRREIRQLSKPQVLTMLVAGIMLALHFSSWFISLKYTSTVSSTLLVCTEPIFVIIGGYLLFREKPCKPALWGLLAAAVGVLLVAMPESGQLASQFSSTAFWGNLLAIFGAISVSGYILAGRSMLGGTSTWLYSTFVYVICCLALWVLTLILGYSVADISLVGLLMAASLALVCQLIGHTICNWALKYTKAANVSSIYLLEPVGTALWVYLLWQEKPSWLVISGGILLLCGIFYFVRSEAQTEPCQNSLN